MRAAGPRLFFILKRRTAFMPIIVRATAKNRRKMDGSDCRIGSRSTGRRDKEQYRRQNGDSTIMKRCNQTVCLIIIFLSLPILRAGDGKVTLIRTPDGGIQPQAAMDHKGVLHLIYFKGEPGAGDVFYVRREPGKESFSAPIQVNSQAGSVIAAGTVRGAHIAVGKRGRVHVAWMGSKNAEPKGPDNSRDRKS